MNSKAILKNIFLWIIIAAILSLTVLGFFNIAFDVDVLGQSDLLFALFTLFFFDIFLALFIWFLAYPYVYSMRQKMYKSESIEFPPINSFRFVISIILHITLIIQLVIIGTPIRHQFTNIIDIFVFFELTILVIFVFSVIYTIKQLWLAYKDSKSRHLREPIDDEQAETFEPSHHVVYGLYGILLAITFSIVIIIIFSILDMKNLVYDYNGLLLTKVPFTRDIMLINLKVSELLKS